MICRRTLLGFTFLLLQTAAARVVEAQRIVDLAVGSKIRVQTADSSRWKIGSLAGVAPDTIQLRQCDSCAVATYLLPSLKAVEVSVGRTQHVGTILGMGFLGAVVGAGAGALHASYKVRNCHDDLCALEYLAVPVYGLAGILIGLITGASIVYDDWQPAPIHER